MRTFWTLIAVLVLAGAAVVWGPTLLASVREEPRMEPIPPNTFSVLPESQLPESQKITAEWVETLKNQAPAPPQTSVPPPAPMAEGNFDGDRPPPDAPGDESAPEPGSTGLDPTTEANGVNPEPDEPFDAMKQQADAAKPEDAAPDETALVEPEEANSALPVPTAPEAATVPGTPAASSAVPAAAEAKIEKRDDGSMLVDDKFIVKGEGTKEKPFEVTWEMLISVSDYYDPQKGRKIIPGRIAMLDGKYVRLTGHIAFPLYVQEPKELLCMLNQWDGCCIGIPPTPYDAVEVQLSDIVKGDDKFTTYGAVEGLLHVKPYVVGDWLVGLYLMDNATMKPQKFGGFGL